MNEHINEVPVSNPEVVPTIENNVMQQVLPEGVANVVTENVKVDENGIPIKERKLDENGFVIEDPDDDAIIFDEDPFQFDVEEVQEAPAIQINGETGPSLVTSQTTAVNVGTEQTGNITF